MAYPKSKFQITLTLSAIWFLATLLLTLIMLDAKIFQKWIKPRQRQVITQTATPEATPSELSNDLEDLRKGVVLIQSLNCDGSSEGSSGTGFIVKPGYIATNFHVIDNSLECERFIVVDSQGGKHHASLVGFSSNASPQDDLAILRIGNTELPTLKLSSEQESSHDGKKIFTIGYPKVGIASNVNRASVSGEGTISQYNSEQNLFITSGMTINPGNSGGPVFTEDKKEVIGLVVMKSNSSEMEGVGWVIPINRFKKLFSEKAGVQI